MKIYIGSDHGGLDLKAQIISDLELLKVEVVDCGSYTAEHTDYPDFAVAVSREVANNKEALGILICRSGEGMEIAANKVRGIRASLCWNKEVAIETRSDNDANICSIPADFVSQNEANEIVKSFMNTSFSGEERHVRRIEKIKNLERREYGR